MRGPDGFNLEFDQHFLKIWSEDIYHKWCQWVYEGQFPPYLNSTNITVIPKDAEQKSTKDWRPITLCKCVIQYVVKCHC